MITFDITKLRYEQLNCIFFYCRFKNANTCSAARGSAHMTSAMLLVVEIRVEGKPNTVTYSEPVWSNTAAGEQNDCASVFCRNSTTTTTTTHQRTPSIRSI
jgi:hypothetical protein